MTTSEPWTLTTLGQICDADGAILQTGPFGSQLHSYDYEPSGIPVVPTEAINSRRLNVNNLPRVSPLTAKRLERHQLRAGDILFARRGIQATGLSAIVKPEQAGWLCGTGAILLRLTSSSVDPEFMSFLLSSSTKVDWLKSHAVGAVMPNLNEGILRNLPLSLPSRREQIRIAEILGSLDDKIELNRRTNETLEAMARTLFRSWFVDFDPVRAKADGEKPHGMDVATAKLFPDSFEKSASGDIPKGWRVLPLLEGIAVNPSRPLSKDTLAPYLEMGNMPTVSARALAWQHRPCGSGAKFVNGDVLLARITPCLENGKTAFVDFLDEGQVGWGSTEYIVFRSKPPLPPEYAYFLARSPELRTHAIQNMTGTSGRQRVPVECFNSFLVVVPPAPIATRFGDWCRPLMAMMKARDEESANLARVRDALLPKLLSGDVNLSKMEASK